MRYRELALIVRLLNLLTRSRVVAILGVLLLLGFSLWQTAHAACPANFTQRYQITGGGCSTVYCGGGGSWISSQIGVQYGSMSAIYNAIESQFQSGTPTSRAEYSWGPLGQSGTTFFKDAYRYDGVVGAGGQIQVTTGDYCVAQPGEPPPDPPTPEEERHQDLTEDCSSKAGQSCAGYGDVPPGTDVADHAYCQASSAAGTGGTMATGGGCACQAQTGASMVSKPSASGGETVQYSGSYSGSTCNTAPEHEDGDVDGTTITEGDNGNCQVGSGSVEVCAAAGAHNCGYVNDTAVCVGGANVSGARVVDSTTPSTTLQDGTQVTMTNAPPSYKPQDANGNPMTPALTFTGTSGTGGQSSFGVYTPNQVANSSNGGGLLGWHGLAPGTGNPTGTAGNTGTGGTGTGTSGDGEGSDEDGTCEEGEGQPDCGQDSISGGLSCDAPPSCTSDQNPIDCYIAKQEWTNACIHKTPSAQEGTAAFEEGFGRSAGVEGGDMLPTHETIDAAEWANNISYGQGACLADIPLNFSLFGQSFNASIPASQLCPFTQFIRVAVLIAAMFVGFRVYMDGFN